MKLHFCLKRKRPLQESAAASFNSQKLVLLFTSLFATTLAGERFFHALLFTRLQVVGVTLHLFDDVFLLHLALKTAQCILKRLTFLQSDLCQSRYTPKLA
jgi:hypothetical protein